MPELIAGVLYGLTKENHLTEVQTCYHSGEQVLKETEEAFSDLTSGKFVKGIETLGMAWN